MLREVKRHCVGSGWGKIAEATFGDDKGGQIFLNMLERSGRRS